MMRAKLIFNLIVAITLGFVPGMQNQLDATDKKKSADNKSRVNSSVSRIERGEINSISAQIDELIKNQLVKKEDSRNRPASDEVFVRRVYLDIIGRIPTMDETTVFLESNKKNKRADLIDDLLDSYGYVSRQFNFMADLLRVNTRLRNISGQPYIDFVKDSLQENKPYDQFVYELLSSNGPLYEEGNGAVGYYFRDVGMPEDSMSNTIRVFLGTRLECAQCHDHPFDKWTQRQYFEMVAFTGGMKFRDRKTESKYAKDIAEIRRSGKVDAQLRPILRRLLEPMTFNLDGTGTGLARLPEGFMGDDGDEFEIVKAKTMFEGKQIVDPVIPKTRRAKKVGKNIHMINGAKPIDSRVAYADWMTSTDNPRFAKVIANRLWKQAFGLALIEPVDTIEDNTVASNPELMDFLTETMIDLDFDMKQFLRAIYNTKTYQALATGSDVTNPREYNFNGPVVRRMSAEQIWDSLLTISVPEIDQRAAGHSALRGKGRTMSPDETIYERYEKLKEMSGEELLELAQTIQDKRGGGMMSMDDATMEMKKQKRKEQNLLNNKKKQFAAEMRKARKAKDQNRIRDLMALRSEYISSYQKNRRGSQLKRASELPSPAPAGHFLREFGQSDREEIENANSDPAVTQVLSLMNGFIEQKVAANPNTVLMKNVYSAKDGGRIEAVFLTMLNRKPTRAEKTVWMNEMEEVEHKQLLPDLIWVLANSNEFIFVK